MSEYRVQVRFPELVGKKLKRLARLRKTSINRLIVETVEKRLDSYSSDLDQLISDEIESLIKERDALR